MKLKNTEKFHDEGAEHKVTSPCNLLFAVQRFSGNSLA